MKKQWVMVALLLPGCGSTIDRLIDDLQNPNPGVRLQAAERLGNMGVRAKPAVPRLTALLLDPDENVRSHVVQSLNLIGSPAHGQLLNALDSPNELLRLGAVKALGEPDPRLKRGFSREDDRKTLSLLMKLFDGQTSEGKNAIIRSLVVVCRSNHEERKLLTWLAPLLASPDKAVVATSAESIGLIARRVGPIDELRPVAKPLAKLIRDDDVAVKRAGLFALGEFGPNAKDVVVSVIKALKDDDEQIQSDAYESLRKLGPTIDNGIPELERMLAEGELSPRAAANARVLIRARKR